MQITNELRQIIQEAARTAAQETFDQSLTRLGIDIDEPIEIQKDMAALRELRQMMSDANFNEDMNHLRRWRKNIEMINKKGLITITGFIVAGILATIWIGVKLLIGK